MIYFLLRLHNIFVYDLKVVLSIFLKKQYQRGKEMQNNSKILSLLSGLIIVLMFAITIPTLCFAKEDSVSQVTNSTELKSANPNSQTYSFTQQPFDAIQLNGAFEMTVQVTHQPRTANVVVTASSDILPYIKVQVKNKTLYIFKRDDWEFHSFKKIKIMVNVDNLESIKINGSSDAHISNIKADNFVAEINGSGDIILQGNVKKLAAEIHGSGDIDAKNLIAEKAKASIYGSGDIIVNTTQKIDINIYGSGTVEYYGNPQEIEQSFSGSGKIKAMGKWHGK